MDREKEFRGAFYFLKRWAKSPLLSSYTIGYSRGIADREPAQKTYNYILKLGEEKSTFEEKFYKLKVFTEGALEEESNKTPGNTTFYYNNLLYINRCYKDIENGIPVKKKRK